MVGKVDLGKYVPTSDELQQARDILAGIDRGSGVHKSKMASMVLFVKAQGGDNSDEILASRGAARTAYLEKYIAYMGKNKVRRRLWSRQASTSSRTRASPSTTAGASMKWRPTSGLPRRRAG